MPTYRVTGFDVTTSRLCEIELSAGDDGGARVAAEARGMAPRVIQRLGERCEAAPSDRVTRDTGREA